MRQWRGLEHAAAAVPDLRGHVGCRPKRTGLNPVHAARGLIDGAIQKTAPAIAANIRALGFRVEDPKLNLNTPAHFDHTGGIAAPRRRSGARVAAMDAVGEGGDAKGVVARDDPAFDTIAPVAVWHRWRRSRTSKP